jgi:tRNA(adenine34) deaminase
VLLARVGTLVWGAPDLRHGAHGSWLNILDQTHPTHTVAVRKGVLADESAELMRKFFRKRREENKHAGII